MKRTAFKIFIAFVTAIVMGKEVPNLVNLVMFDSNNQPLQANVQSNIISEGRFATQLPVYGGLFGAPWTLYSDGILVVDEGFINWAGWFSPWHRYHHYINEIIFEGPITAGFSLQNLFSGLFNVTAIE